MVANGMVHNIRVLPGVQLNTRVIICQIYYLIKFIIAYHTYKLGLIGCSSNAVFGSNAVVY